MPDCKIETYPGLKRAALEIAYDNGMINRFEPKAEYLSSLDQVLADYFPADLETWSKWLNDRSDEAIQIITCGETTEMEALMAIAPTSTHGPSLNDLLNAMFERPPIVTC